MKKSLFVVAALGLSLPWACLAWPTDNDPALNSRDAGVPSTTLRRSPDFVVHFTDGKELPLSNLRGNVVALIFVHTACPVCQQASQVLTKLYAEYGSRGFQPVGVAFDSQASLRVTGFVKKFEIGYPVGFSFLEDVAAYLDFPAGDRFTIPQIVWIDSNGYIRAATPLKGGDEMLTEPYWRNMIETLLKEIAED